MFHNNCGHSITLVNQNATAVRDPIQVDNAVVFGSEPLIDDLIFEIQIDKKDVTAFGEFMLGVTTCDPETIPAPELGVLIPHTTWLLSSTNLIKDGENVPHTFLLDFDEMYEGTCVGVVRTAQAELKYYMDGKPLGIAAVNVPGRLFAVIDLSGQFIQISISDAFRLIAGPDSDLERIREEIEDIEAEGASTSDAHNSLMVKWRSVTSDYWNWNAGVPVWFTDKLSFHSKCGLLVKLSENNSVAERMNPFEDYNNGVVMTNRPLYKNEPFEIEIERIVRKWSGNIEIGVTTHNPDTMKFPTTMTNIESGTIIMSGCKVLVNGCGSGTETKKNLDELKRGDRVGLIRKSNGDLHFFINGEDQGVAAVIKSSKVWGVIDLYGMTVKVMLVDNCNSKKVYLDAPVASTSAWTPDESQEDCARPHIDEDKLLFHAVRDSNVVIVNYGKTAHRPITYEGVDNGIVMTNRMMRPNELFQVRIEHVVLDNEVSVEIGVTELTPNEIELPFRLHSSGFGTWGLAEQHVYRDSIAIVKNYTIHLNQLVEGDLLGVMRRDNGVLHFFLNGRDQGPAAYDVPENIFGIVDLNGRVTQIVIDYQLPSTDVSMSSHQIVDMDGSPDMCFHRIHGEGIHLNMSLTSAFRSNVLAPIDDAVVFSSRPLRECEMFEVRVDSIGDTSYGTLDFGVIGLAPELLQATVGINSAYDIHTAMRNQDTILLNGTTILKDYKRVRTDYAFDLEVLNVGSRLGLMWHADRSLHYYLDGIDQGRAWRVPHLNIYAVIDLHGCQCMKLTILQNEDRCIPSISENVVYNIRATFVPKAPYSFSEYCGENVLLEDENTLAMRKHNVGPSTLVFSAGHLVDGHLFEVEIIECVGVEAGGFRIGVTDLNILNAYVHRSLPPYIGQLPYFTSYVDGYFLRTTLPRIKSHQMRSVTPSFNWLHVTDRVGLKKVYDKVYIYFNGDMIETQIVNVPDKVFVVMELGGTVTKIKALSRLARSGGGCPPQPLVESTIDDLASTGTGNSLSPDSPPNEQIERPFTFNYIHGKNIQLMSSDTVARRVNSYNDGVTVANQPISRGQSFRIRIDKVTDSWSGTIGIGAIASLPNKALPRAAHSIDAPAWIITSELIWDNGECLYSKLGAPLEGLDRNEIVTLNFANDGQLNVEYRAQVLAIARVPSGYTKIYPVVDVYGRVQQVSIMLQPFNVGRCTSLDFKQLVLEVEGQPDPEPRLQEWLEPEVETTSVPDGEPDETENDGDLVSEQEDIDAVDGEDIEDSEPRRPHSH